jgi:hypothetical protein
MTGDENLISNFYKPPTANSINFSEQLDALLHNLIYTTWSSFIFSDAITCWKLQITNLQEYLDVAHCKDFLQIISKATRISGDTFYLIDHVLCNDFHRTLKL